MEKIRLPIDRLQTVKNEIWAKLNQRDRAAAEIAYAWLLQFISHPLAVTRGRFVYGTTSLQYFLNLIVFLRRIFWPIVLLIIIIAVLQSWFVLLILPALVFLEFFVLNNLQTRLNVLLGARLLVLDEYLLGLDSKDKKKT